jgi:hypothetical protein
MSRQRTSVLGIDRAMSLGTLEKFRMKFSQIFRRRSQNICVPAAVIETDFLPSGETTSTGETATDNKDDLKDGPWTTGNYTGLTSMLDNSGYGTFEEPIDESLCQDVCLHLHAKLRDSQSILHFRLLMHANLMRQIADDIVRMSCHEPCGLRGCLLHLSIERKQKRGLQKLGQIQFDPHTVTTFELYLTLIEDSTGWLSLRRFITKLISGCLHDTVTEDIFVSPGFRLMKEKLYRGRST